MLGQPRTRAAAFGVRRILAGYARRGRALRRRPGRLSALFVRGRQTYARKFEGRRQTRQGAEPRRPAPRAPAKAKPLQQALAKLDKTLTDLQNEKIGLETRLASAAAKDITDIARNCSGLMQNLL